METIDEHINYIGLVVEDREHPERTVNRDPVFATPAECPCGCGATPATLDTESFHVHRPTCFGDYGQPICGEVEGPVGR